MLKKGCDFIKKIFILLVVFAILLTSCASEKIQFSSSVQVDSTSENIEKEYFIADNLGIQFEHSSSWYINDVSSAAYPYLEILYSTDVVAKIYLLNGGLDNSTATSKKIEDLLKAHYNTVVPNSYQSEVVDFSELVQRQTGTTDWIEMTAYIKNTYFRDTVPYDFPQTEQVTFYFINVQDIVNQKELGYFIQMESLSQNKEYVLAMDDIVSSIRFTHNPYGYNYAFSFEELVYGGISYVDDVSSDENTER